tara:strand:+ start:592 stop:975 length:384 start_codon:yes stop_codon:yes gene_type:complete
MPILNSKKANLENDIHREIEPVKKQILELKSLLKTMENDLQTFKLKILQEQKEDEKERKELMNKLTNTLTNFISYTDKKRVNTCIKDLTTIKKQINLSKTSKIMKEISSIKERLENIEESFVSDDEQ